MISLVVGLMIKKEEREREMERERTTTGGDGFIHPGQRMDLAASYCGTACCWISIFSTVMSGFIAVASYGQRENSLRHAHSCFSVLCKQLNIVF